MRHFRREELLAVPDGSVVCLAGAGGKTTLLHEIGETVRRRGSTVLLTTTTHMFKEKGLVTETEGVRAALLRDGLAFAGKPDPKNPRKICAAPGEELRDWMKLAAVSVIEADGSRGLPFKVPYAHEPVIPEGATHIAVLYGAAAEGWTIGEAAYNPEGTAALLAERFPEAAAAGVETVLTRELMEYALFRSYVEPLKSRFPMTEIGILRVGSF